MQFYTFLRHEVLAPREVFVCPDFSLLWGRYPPHRRYNMDQVPLPFVVSQESTHTTGDDDDVHVSCPNEALRKRQFTMHVFCNAGEGEKRDGYVALVCKGSPRGRRTVIEKLAYDSRVPMHFQKNAWVDTACMIEIAEEFIEHVRKKHDGLGVLLFCDNLKAHVAPEVRDVFARGNVFS